MKQNFREIYTDLFSDYIYEIDNPKRLFFKEFEIELLVQVRRAIDKFDRSIDNNKTLRPDAKYFLLVNYHNMIIKPIMESFKFQSIPLIGNFSKVKKELEDDIYYILSTSIERITKDEEKSEVSGHYIMKVIDEKWKELKLTRFELWND